MEKTKTKKLKVSNLLKYISLFLIVLSIVAYFFPFLTFTSPATFQQTHYSGLDFTTALISNEQTLRILEVKSFFENELTSVTSYVIAIMGPVCCVYSLIVFILTMLSFFKPKLNNIFVLGGFFVVWIVLAISVVAFVGSMGVTRGEFVVNNYSLNFGIALGVLLVLTASVLNIFANLLAE